VTHSVEQHLVVSPEEYDAAIRRFVPSYDAMLAEVVEALGEHLGDPRGTILDLGAGTGALAADVAAALPEAKLVLLDVDEAMLARARRRLDGEGRRVELVVGSFFDPLPACDAAIASLSLHHVRDPAEKQRLYENILAALRPGGVLIDADASIPSSSALAAPLMRRWASHLAKGGDTDAEAYARFDAWAKEDLYLGLDATIDLLRAAGFGDVEIRFRIGPSSVVVARKPAA
jgi:tRNA (cmo5U34)-methyltransferase